MKILWFPRLQPDINKLHLATWRGMCTGLEALGCTVKVALTGKDDENILDRECIEIFLIKRKFLRILSFWFSGYMKFVYHYFKFKPDVVILDINSMWFSLPFVLMKKRKVVFIIDERTPLFDVSPSNKNGLQDKVIYLYTRLCYRYAQNYLDGITVITTYFKKFINEKFGFPVESIDVWSSGVDVDSFSPRERVEIKDLSSLKDKFVIMQHGEFSDNRGILETIEAIKLTGKKDVCLMLIGEGRQKNNILARAEELGLSDNIYVLPPKKHSVIPDYISNCDCAVMAYPDLVYWNNNNPIKLLEYFAMEKVVICTDMWTFRNVADDKKCACYIKNNDPETIAEAINYCYENRERLNEWGRVGRDIVKENYTWHQQAKTLLDFVVRLQKTSGRNQ